MKAQILAALDAFVRQRPGFEPGNYNSMLSYLSDVRRATRQLNDARALMAAVSYSGITAEDILAQAKGTRLELETKPKIKVYYCAGQYYCTEFRGAVCAALAATLWYYHRGDAEVEAAKSGRPVCEIMIQKGRRLLGRGVAKRWFS